MIVPWFVTLASACAFLPSVRGFARTSNLPTVGKESGGKIVVQPREKVQFISSSGKHITYYNPTTQRVKYRYLGKECGVIPDVFQKKCTGLSDLDVFAREGFVYVAMAYYSVARNDHSMEIAVISFDTMTVHTYPHPVSVRHDTFIRKCAFVVLHGFLSLVSWSIDGTRIVHRIGSDKWSVHKFPFQVYHVMVSENTVGLLDNDFYFHVFHPDGGYRNMTVDNITLPVSACHFSVPAKQLTIAFPDGTLRMHSLNCEMTKKFAHPIRSVYADSDMLMVFLDNGDVSIGEVRESLPEVMRWHNVFSTNDMHRFIYRKPYLITDGDTEGFVVRKWSSIPSERGLMARIRQATMAKEQAEDGTNHGVNFEQFLRNPSTTGSPSSPGSQGHSTNETKTTNEEEEE